MGRPRTNNVQINIAIPGEWKKELENLARIYSVEEGKTITFLDLTARIYLFSKSDQVWAFLPNIS